MRKIIIIFNNKISSVYIMAEIALPFMALAGAYLLSNRNDDNDDNCNFKNEYKNEVVKDPLEIIKQNVMNDMKPLNSMAAVNSLVERVEENRNEITLLNGEKVLADNFKHNNAVPFFGSSIKGPSLDKMTDGFLDNKVGGGSLYNRKQAQAPLFQPKTNITNINGAQNVNDYLQSRVVSSLRHANTKPWQEERVQPGLNQGYITTNSGSGYNNSVEGQNLWKPKTVDELRTETNPKITYNLSGHEGPLLAPVQNAANKDTIGKVEKHLPDRHYEVGPDRWFTTTSDRKGQTIRSNNILPQVSRPDTTVEYYGSKGAGRDGEASYTVGEYEESHKQGLGSVGVTNYAAAGQYNSNKYDYGANGYKALPNNRVTTNDSSIFRNIQGVFKAVVSPIIDVLRPSRKENVVGNVRTLGNMANTVKQTYLMDPNDRVRTTIKETTEGRVGFNHLNVQGQNSDGYLVTEHNPVGMQRDTTTNSYIGNAGPSESKSATSYIAGYNQENNNTKTMISRPNPGGTGMLNTSQNVSVAKCEMDRNNNRMYVPANGPRMVPSMETHGTLSGPEYNMNENNNMNNRMDSGLLDAFKKNPYTHSLNSYY